MSVKPSEPIRIGVIGGSGVYAIEQLQDIAEVTLKTPFGAPSDAYIVGTLESQHASPFCPATATGTASIPAALTTVPTFTDSRCWVSST